METDRRIVDDVPSAAAELVASALVAGAERGRVVLSLSGGSTPLAMFDLLAQRPDLPWDLAWFVWGDERYVPHDDPRSNARAARAALLDRVPIPDEQIVPWPTEAATPDEAVTAYAAALDRVAPGPIRFDLTLLGLGADAHTASLFPGTGAALAGGTTVVVRPPGIDTVRLSMTAATLSSTHTAAFLVAGASKRDALAETLAGEGDPDRFPARAIAPRERLLWLVDAEAAGGPDVR